MKTDIFPVAQAVVTLLAALVTAVLIPWLKKKCSAEKMAELALWVEVAVLAAEQLLGSGQGQAKKEYVLRLLEKRGFSADPGELEALIEAKVISLVGSLKGQVEQ